MRRRKIIIIVSALLAIAAACFFDVYRTTVYSCLECRATLTKSRICVITFQHTANDSYSKSFLAGFPSHQHQWCWCGSEQSYSLSSVTYAWGPRHPIWGLPVSVQAEYSQLVPASELQQTLQAIDSPDRNTAEARVNKVYERVSDSR